MNTVAPDGRGERGERFAPRCSTRSPRCGRSSRGRGLYRGVDGVGDLGSGPGACPRGNAAPAAYGGLARRASPRPRAPIGVRNTLRGQALPVVVMTPLDRPDLVAEFGVARFEPTCLERVSARLRFAIARGDSEPSGDPALQVPDLRFHEPGNTRPLATRYDYPSKAMGSTRGPRTCPFDHVTAAGSARRKGPTRSRNFDTAT